MDRMVDSVALTRCRGPHILISSPSFDTFDSKKLSYQLVDHLRKIIADAGSKINLLSALLYCCRFPQCVVMDVKHHCQITFIQHIRSKESRLSTQSSHWIFPTKQMQVHYTILQANSCLQSTSLHQPNTLQYFSLLALV